MTKGTNVKGQYTEYTYNGLGQRVENKQFYCDFRIMENDFVVDLTSAWNNDLMVVSSSGVYSQKNIYGVGQLSQMSEIVGTSKMDL